MLYSFWPPCLRSSLPNRFPLFLLVSEADDAKKHFFSPSVRACIFVEALPGLCISPARVDLIDGIQRLRLGGAPHLHLGRGWAGVLRAARGPAGDDRRLRAGRAGWAGHPLGLGPEQAAGHARVHVLGGGSLVDPLEDIHRLQFSNSPLVF